MFLLGQDDDLCYPVAAGVEGQPALGGLVDLAAPPVNGLDRSEIVRAGAQPLLDQLPAQVLEPARVRGYGARWASSASSAQAPSPHSGFLPPFMTCGCGIYLCSILDWFT